MQTETDAKRARFFGAAAEVIGNSKYDVQLPQQSGPDWDAALDLKKDEPLVVFGSIRGEEEENLTLDAIADIPCKVLFAPRHIERAEQIVAKARGRGLSAGRFSLGETDARLVILDQIGLLGSAYSRAAAAVIGGGFAPLGGQNIIEPLAAGCPVICGPNMHNFRQPFEEGVRTGAVLAAADSAQIVLRVQKLLADPARRRSMGEAGRRLVEQHRGSAKKYALRLAALANSPGSQKQGVSEKPMR
jgi:3-deoxy-D-manno-octulosonic-acid transferase